MKLVKKFIIHIIEVEKKKDILCIQKRKENDFNLEEKILLEIDIEILKEALSKLSNNEYRIILEIFYNCKSEREVAKELNYYNVVLHNKKKKILYKLKDYLKNNKFI